MVKNAKAVTMNTELHKDSGFSSSILVGPQNVTNRLSCIIRLYGRGGSADYTADSDNKIGNYLNLMPKSSFRMENEAMAINSKVGRQFGYAQLVGMAIYEVDTNSIPEPPKFDPLEHEINMLDQCPHKRSVQEYAAAKYPPCKQHYGDWSNDSNEITECMNMKLISEVNHEVSMKNTLIPEDDLPKTFVPEHDAAQSSQRKQKYVHSSKAYCCQSSGWIYDSSAIGDSASSSPVSKSAVSPRIDTEGVFWGRKTSSGLHFWFGEDEDYYVEGDAGNLEEHINDVIRRVN